MEGHTPSITRQLPAQLEESDQFVEMTEAKTSMLDDYDHVIKDQMSHRIIERVSDIYTAGMGRVNHLPHHAVMCKDQQSSKFCVVYNTSARCNCLYAGPKFRQNIVEILLWFCM